MADMNCAVEKQLTRESHKLEAQVQFLAAQPVCLHNFEYMPQGRNGKNC